MKKISALMMVLALAIGLSGCPGKEKGSSSDGAGGSTSASSGPSAEGKAAMEAIARGDFASLTPAQMENLQAVIETNKGVIKFKFYPDGAPESCRNFIKLAASNFYNGLIFHRVVPGFVIQGGDPQGTGMGGPGWNVKAEFNSHKHLAGTVAMARASDPDSAGSQFYICLKELPMLDNQYTVFGQVTEGMEAVNAIGSVQTGDMDRPIEPQTMTKITIQPL